MSDANVPQTYPHVPDARDRRPAAPVRLVVADVDGTLVGDDLARDQFRARWLTVDDAY